MKSRRLAALIFGLALSTVAANAQYPIGNSTGNNNTPANTRPGAGFGSGFGGYSGYGGFGGMGGGFNMGGTTYGGGYPIGTSTQETPRNYGMGGLIFTPGQFSYYNNPGLGYFRTGAYSAAFPAAIAPKPLGGGYYQFGGMNGICGYWRGPSGYFYPWCPAAVLSGAIYMTPGVYTVDQGTMASTKPPVSQVLSDLRSFVDDAKRKSQLDQSSYEQISGTLNDINAQVAQLSVKNGGVLDASDEELIRRQLEGLITDITRVVNP